jgi:hypothetical protein
MTATSPCALSSQITHPFSAACSVVGPVDVVLAAALSAAAEGQLATPVLLAFALCDVWWAFCSLAAFSSCKTSTPCFVAPLVSAVATASLGDFLAGAKVPFLGWAESTPFQNDPTRGLGIDGLLVNPDARRAAGGEGSQIHRSAQVPNGCSTLLKTVGAGFKVVTPPYECLGDVNVVKNKSVDIKTGGLIP